MMQLAPEYKERKIPEHFRALAFAYLDAAERLCRELTDGSWQPTYHRGQVTLWLAFHATELFLKGCIWKVAPGKVKNSHSLGKLILTFESEFPSIPFEAPFGVEPMPADWELMQWALETDRTLHEQLRYPVNTKGAQWPGIRSFSPDLFLAELSKLRARFLRIAEVVFS